MGSKRASRRGGTPPNSNQYLGVNQIGMVGTSSPPAGSLSCGRRAVHPIACASTQRRWIFGGSASVLTFASTAIRMHEIRSSGRPRLSVEKTHRVTVGTKACQMLSTSSSLPASKEQISVLTLFGPEIIAVVDLRSPPPDYWNIEGRPGPLFGRRNRKRMVVDRRYRYGDPKPPSRFWAVGQFVGSIVLPATGKCPYQPLVIGFALQVGGCGRFWSVYAVEDRQS